MKKFKVVVFETVRHEVIVEAKDEMSARTKAGFATLDESTEDMDYFESEIVDVEEVTDES